MKHDKLMKIVAKGHPEVWAAYAHYGTDAFGEMVARKLSLIYDPRDDDATQVRLAVGSLASVRRDLDFVIANLEKAGKEITGAKKC